MVGGFCAAMSVGRDVLRPVDWSAQLLVYSLAYLSIPVEPAWVIMILRLWTTMQVLGQAKELEGTIGWIRVSFLHPNVPRPITAKRSFAKMFGFRKI